MKFDKTTPCNECPFRKKSIPGWLGGGGPEGIDRNILKAVDLEVFKVEVGNFLSREDATSNKEGWPWPWEDSTTTDYSYVFDKQQDQVYISCFDGPFFTWKEDRKFDAAEKRYYKKWRDDLDNAPDAPDFDKFLSKIGRNERFTFPNMKDKQNIKLDVPASGLIVVRRTK